MRTAQPAGCTSVSDRDAIEAYLSWMLDVRGRQPLTVDSYRSTLQSWLKYLDWHTQGTTLWSADLDDLEGFQQRPRQKRGRGGNGAAATQRREVTCIKGFYRWACARGYLAEDPMTEAIPPSVKSKQPRPITDKVWLQAWGQDMPDTLRAAMGLGFFCGLRRAEIVRLTVDQLTETRIIDFIRKGGGEDTLSWRSMVDVYAQHLPDLGHEQFLDAFSRARRAGYGGYLLPYQDPDWLNRAMHREGVPFTPHNLRHSAATNLIRAGVPLPIVSRLMNHTSINTTMLYVKAGGDELRDWLRRT